MNVNKRVLITGASRGIGAAIARRLAREGYSLLLHGNRSVESLSDLCEELGAQMLLADLSDEAAVLELARQAGEVDVLIHSAGIASYGLYQDLSNEELSELMNVDLRAPMILTRELISAMIRKGEGSVVFISSIWGETGAAMEVAYSAVKAGLIGFSKALAKELAPSGVRVNCVCPGAVDTDMMADFTEDEKAALAEMIPLGRLGQAEEVADCVEFLVSASSSYLTGQVLSPNGGLYM